MVLGGGDGWLAPAAEADRRLSRSRCTAPESVSRLGAWTRHGEPDDGPGGPRKTSFGARRELPRDQWARTPIDAARWVNVDVAMPTTLSDDRARLPTIER